MFQPEILMEKMGWKRGEGLGKHLQGIKDPIRTVKKQDHAGIGQGYVIQDFAFWDAVYSKASNNLKIQTTGNEGVIIQPCDHVTPVPSPYQCRFVSSTQKQNHSFDENILISRCLSQKKHSNGKLARLERVAQVEQFGHLNSDASISDAVEDTLHLGTGITLEASGLKSKKSETKSKAVSKKESKKTTHSKTAKTDPNLDSKVPKKSPTRGSKGARKRKFEELNRS